MSGVNTYSRRIPGKRAIRYTARWQKVSNTPLQKEAKRYLNIYIKTMPLIHAF